jgi:hypothetical protein
MPRTHGSSGSVIAGAQHPHLLGKLIDKIRPSEFNQRNLS